MSRPKKSIDERNAMRERILAAASDLLERHGADEISIRAVTASLGISPMSFYSYFTSRGDLITALGEQQLRSLQESAANYLARAERAGAGPILREVLGLLVESVCLQPRRYLLLWTIPAGAPQAALVRPWRLDMLLDFFTRLIEQGMLQGNFRPGDPRVAALTVFSTVNGALLLRVSGRLPDSGQFDALAHESVDLALRYVTGE